MPRELLDESGNRVEVPDEAELKALNDKVASVDALNKEIETLKEGVNPNWKAIRDKETTLEAQIAEAKKERDDLIKAAQDKGVNLVETPQVTADQINEIAEKRANEVFLRRFRAAEISKYGERAAEVEALVGKFMAGEENNETNITKFISVAARGLGIENNKQPIMNIPGTSGFPADKNSGGEAPRYSETEAGKALAKNLGLDENDIKKEVNKTGTAPLA